VRLVGRVLNNLGTLSMELGRLDAAERLLRAALEAKRRGDAGDIDCGRTLFNLAETAVDAGRYDAGLAYAEQASRQLVAGGHWRLAAFASSTAALAHMHGGDVAAATAACGRATALLDEEEHDDCRISTIVDLRRSVAAHAAGDRAGAAALLRHAVPAGLDSPERDREELAYAIEMHAELTAPRDPVGAARMLGTAHRLRRGSIRLATPAWKSVASRAEAVCWERLGGNAFKRRHRQGFALDPLGLREMSTSIERG
jgi:tetratricopeptide (TPR) repeat protein